MSVSLQVTDNLYCIFYRLIILHVLANCPEKHIVRKRHQPSADTKNRFILRRYFGESITFCLLVSFFGIRKSDFSPYIFMCMYNFPNQNKGLIKLRPLFCVYPWESIIFSINIPYPFWGLFTKTCVTAPISLSF